MKQQHWPDPTPASTRAEDSRQVRAARREQDRGPGGLPFPARSATVRRSLTIGEEARVNVRSRKLVTRTPEEQAMFKSDVGEESVLAGDYRGLPCACGPDSDPRPCLLHAAVRGHRRHARPGQGGRHWGSRKGDKGRPDVPPEYDV